MICAARSRSSDLKQMICAARSRSSDLNQMICAARSRSSDLKQMICAARSRSSDLKQLIWAARSRSSDLNQMIYAARSRSSDLNQMICAARSRSSDLNQMICGTAEDHRRRAGKTDKPSQNRRISFSFADVSSEFDFSDIDSSAIKYASAPAQRTINGHDSSDLKPDVQTNEESTQKPLKITGTDTEEHEQTSPDSLVSLLTIFKEELKHCEDAPQMVSQEPVQFKSPSFIRSTQSNERKPDTPRPKSSVKWKNVMMQRARCTLTFPYENQDPAHGSWRRFTPADESTHADRRDTDRADVTPERPAEDHIKNGAAGDTFTPQ